jgi:hypothetical protein
MALPVGTVQQTTKGQPLMAAASVGAQFRVLAIGPTDKPVDRPLIFFRARLTQGCRLPLIDSNSTGLVFFIECSLIGMNFGARLGYS